MAAQLIVGVGAQLAGVSAAWRTAAAEGPEGPGLHARLVSEARVLHGVEVELPPAPLAASLPAVRVAFWNVERGKYLEPSARLLGRVGADVNLLAELDRGMARSGQRHTARELALRLGQGYAFAVEFIELGLGDERETAWHAGETNAEGLHGGAILTRLSLKRPGLIRLESEGAWFGKGCGQRRVGGRMAVVATAEVAGRDVVFASVHFESHGDPQQRADQMGALLDAIDDYDSKAPAIIGGDFNTNTGPHPACRDPAWRSAGLAADPERLVDPARYEPLFGLAAAAGYDWRAANTRQPTERTRPDGAPRPPHGRIDWFFTRRLAASKPATVAAVDDRGIAISDHELIAVTIAPEEAP